MAVRQEQNKPRQSDTKIGEKRSRQGRKLTRAKKGKKDLRGKLLEDNRVRGKASIAGRSMRKAQSKSRWHEHITTHQQRKTVMRGNWLR